MEIKDINLFENWTLFLDRDGVINVHRPDDYVKKWSEWTWQEGVRDAIALLSQRFARIIVVTNQQGVAKGLMNEKDLTVIHRNMCEGIAAAGGRIDKVYYAPELKTDPGNRRKPKPDLAYEAYQDFPKIDFSKSVMVGDSNSDMEFGKALNMHTVRIKSAHHTEVTVPANLEAESLLDFAQMITRISI